LYASLTSRCVLITSACVKENNHHRQRRVALLSQRGRAVLPVVQYVEHNLCYY